MYVMVQVELLELLADVDYKFVVYLESVGFTSATTLNHRFLGVSCYDQYVRFLCIVHYSG